MGGGRLPEEEKRTKILYLQKAIEALKEVSTIHKNMCTISNVCEHANEGWQEKGWAAPIGEGSVKNKSKNSFCKKIRDEIFAFKEEHKALKITADDKAVHDIGEQRKTIDKLTIRITDLLHNEIDLKNIIVEKEKTIQRLQEEISSFSERKGTK